MGEEFLRVLRAPKAEAEDYLKVFAEFLADQGFKFEALNVIREAAKRRPRGPRIRDLRMLLERELDRSSREES
jgi:ATP-dependent protease Clp ATPase subunit